jgi:hypothetical protein
LLAISYNMELSETKIKIFCNFAAYCRNNIFVLPMKIRLFTIPNLLTLASLLCGSFAVVSALVYGDLALAFWLTIAAGVFDYSDGFVARLLKCPSAIGVQLDSLSDMVSFGFAPSAVLFVLWNNSLPADAEAWLRYGGSALCFAVAAFSALRLAKFNIDETQHTEFCGLPTPANALFFISLGWIKVKTGFDLGYWLLLLIPVMSWLLVSPVRMFAFKFQHFAWKGNGVRYVFIVSAALLLAVLGVRAVPVVIVLYIATSVVRWLSMKAKGCGQAG